MKSISLHDPNGERGTVLFVALILSMVIAVSLTSYITLSRSSFNISNRALYNNAAMNLAENGLEEAMYTINKNIENDTNDWSAWLAASHDGNAVYRQKWNDATFEQNATGEVRTMVVNPHSSSDRTLVAWAQVQLGNGGAPIEKWVEVKLGRTSKFANGLVAKESIWFKGNQATVDSWNSEKNDDGTPRGAPVPYSAGVAHDKGSVGSISVSVDAILVQNADIWGFAATGGADPEVGPNGLVGPYGTTAGTMDPDHVSTDFTADFDPVAQPTGGTSIAAITGPTTLSSGTYSLASIALSGNSTNVLTITGDVVLYITADEGEDAISVGGSASIAIDPGASLIIYTKGDVDIGGNGVLNGGTTAATANQPKNFQLWGTSTSTSPLQDISIKGNGVLSGIVYAPNGTVDIVGNGDVMGSVVANDITLTGNANFHYDESLADLDDDSPFRVTKWKELTTAAERATYRTSMTW
jgi:Tfp pilus assembly protein PilX